ncbi:MAG TPA: 16S rRNA (guanine(966)-N(2))-methyltransferase RsmD [Ktedonobacterales bacterium]|jgi:16S rRNA (guanine966-N2)-methyltransferase|nr:16S rRNA (guanine(966)-N(2))-methyltransferase RsmD [Ktedonobacterales bacterium]
MRVIAGIAKGRQLKSPKSPNVRPIMDRVKTALFDILAPEIEGARFLDLFAGAGGVGIEALSRGAEAVTFVELDTETWKLIGENLRITGLGERAETLHADAFRFVERAHASSRRYDIVYVAPPQYQGMAGRALAQLDARPLTEPGGLVIVQIDPRERKDVDALELHTLTPIDERRYGGTLLIFYEHSDQDADSEDHEDKDDDQLE